MLTQEKLRSLLSYCQETGLFTRIKSRRRHKFGEVAGTVRLDGYIHIKIEGTAYLAHRLAWLYVTGKFPDKEIDHINNIKSDNSWSNLRESTRSENERNQGIQKNNKLGIKGVSKRGNRFTASVKSNKQYYYIGNFKTAKEAAEAYQSFTKKLHGDFYHG